MELSRRERSLRTLTETHTAGAGQSHEPRPARAALSWDRLPWKLDHDGKPQSLVVVDVLTSTSYLVRYPNGSTEILVDSE